MAKFSGISAFSMPPVLIPPTPPIPDPVIRVFPGFVWQLASSVRDSTSQRAQLLTDINAIETAKGFRCAVSINISWDDIEQTMTPGAYTWTKLDDWMNWGVANNIVIYFKIFFRNYNFNTAPNTDSSTVPPYMRDGSTVGGLNSYRGMDLNLGSGGINRSANGEYQGVHKLAISRNAKLWVPGVANGLRDVFIAIGGRYNNNVLFGGIWINETSPIQPDASLNTGMSPNNPISNDTVLNMYFQGLWGAVRDARSSLSKCMIFLSPNGPAFGTTNVFNTTPFNVINTARDALCGIGLQDYYKVGPTKPSITEIYAKTQPLAGLLPFGGLYSGEVSKAKADGTTPPWPIDTTIAYYVTATTGYAGADTAWFQVNATLPPGSPDAKSPSDPTSNQFNEWRYRQQVDYLMVLNMSTRYPKTVRPSLLPT